MKYHCPNHFICRSEIQRFMEEYVEKALLVEFHHGKGWRFLICTASSKVLAGEKYYKLSPKSILELDGEIRCYYEGRSMDPNCAACKSLGKFSF